MKIFILKRVAASVLLAAAAALCLLALPATAQALRGTPAPQNVIAETWTWVSGSNAYRQFGTYGTKGLAAPGNVPGARSGSVSWTDTSGNLWLFGGYGYVAGTDDYLNELWKFDVTSGEWTWVSGSNAYRQFGTYGTKGLAAPGNVPGARSGSVSWTDTNGNLWLFGGYGSVAGRDGLPPTDDYSNELWK